MKSSFLTVLLGLGCSSPKKEPPPMVSSFVIEEEISQNITETVVSQELSPMVLTEIRGVPVKTAEPEDSSLQLGKPLVQGALDRAIIERTVHQKKADIEHCYQNELAQNPDLEGNVVMKFAISAQGVVLKTVVESSSLDSEPVEACLLRLFVRLEFPKPKGSMVIVKYPLDFQPLEP